MISLGVLAPHPPIIVEGVGKPADLAEVADTIKSMKEIDRILAADQPETLVVFTPHGTVFSDAIVIYGDKYLTGSLSRFGHHKKWQWDNDLELVEKIIVDSPEVGLPVLKMDSSLAAKYRAQDALDHGVLVPLSFFDQKWADRVKLVIIPLSYLPLEELYRFGTVVQKAAEQLNRKVAIIASGDLSHCLKSEAPAGYNPKGLEFDQKIISLIKESNLDELFQLDPVLVEKAAECGFRSLIMLAGTLDRLKYESKVFSYQGPFGVGYGVASFKPTGEKQESLTEELFANRQRKVDERHQKENSIVRYARQVVEAYVRDQKLPEPENLEPFLTEKAGTFVSIKKHGQLRGCIGTTEPTQNNIVAEVRQNAISASTRDPRFNPVEEEELADLVFSVDILKPAEPISGLDELNPEKYGVIVSQGYRRGLLLPNLEGIDTAEEQVKIAKQKAGIGNDEDVQLERFEVVRYY